MKSHRQLSNTGRILISVMGTIALILSIGCSQGQKTEETIMPPVAEKKPKEMTIHGHTRIDEYYWLNERENPEVIAYLVANN